MEGRDPVLRWGQAGILGELVKGGAEVFWRRGLELEVFACRRVLEGDVGGVEGEASDQGSFGASAAGVVAGLE